MIQIILEHPIFSFLCICVIYDAISRVTDSITDYMRWKNEKQYKELEKISRKNENIR